MPGILCLRWRQAMRHHYLAAPAVILACTVLACRRKTGGEVGMTAEPARCQSCSMALENPEQFGTNADGSRAEDYCHFCFKDGAFTEPDVTMEEMIQRVSSMLAQHSDMTESEATELMRDMIPGLKRWKDAQ